MKKSMIKSMAVLCVCAAFASCSHDADFEPISKFEQNKSEYENNFVKKYGAIDPNQSWDFTNNGNTAQARVTRSVAPYESLMKAEGANFFSFCKSDLEAIQTLQDNSKNSCSYTVKIGNYRPVSKKVTASAYMMDWAHFFTAKLSPSFSCIKKTEKTVYYYYHLGFSYNGGNPVDMIANISVVGHTNMDYWYEPIRSEANIHRFTRSINTVNAAGNGVWYAYYIDEKTGNTRYHYTPITQVRVFKVQVEGEDERTFWGFDCDGDGIFTDVVCLVNDYTTPDPIRKRYMVEDLGSTNDFDFNDIVVDFVDDLQGHKKAYIRAMGGTLDFTLNVAGQKVWTKSVDGAKLANPITIADMVNTTSIDYTKVYDEVDVPAWNADANNISVTITYKDATTETGTNVYTIDFPEVGRVPMMFATDPIVPWMVEYDNFPEWWFKNVAED